MEGFKIRFTYLFFTTSTNVINNKEFKMSAHCKALHWLNYSFKMVVIYDILLAFYASSALHIYEILLFMGLQIQVNWPADSRKLARRFKKIACNAYLRQRRLFFHRVEIKNAYLLSRENVGTDNYFSFISSCWLEYNCFWIKQTQTRLR